MVGTPGIISKLIKCKYLNLSNLETFVIDEADELVNLKGFLFNFKEINAIFLFII